MSTLALGLRLRQLRLTSVTSCSSFQTNTFHSSRITAVEKKALNKKITLPKDPYLLSEKVVKFARNGKLDDAITLVLEAPKSRQNEIVWNHLIQESSKLGKASQSWQLLNDMKKRGFEPSARTYTILLNALAINTASPTTVSRARALYTQMEESEDNQPTLVHTNALLKVCSRAKDYDALTEVLNSMPNSGPRAPDVVTYNILINAYARQGGDLGFDLAWKTWEEFLTAKTKRPDELDLDSGLVDAVLLACTRAQSKSLVRRAYKLIESLYGLELPTTTASEAGKMLAKASVLSPSSTSSSDNKDDSTQTSYTTATERAMSPSKSLGLGAALRKDSIHPRTVGLLMTICSKLRDFGRAHQYLDHIKTVYPDFKPDAHLLASVILLQTEAKDYKGAIATWDQIKGQGLDHSVATMRNGLSASMKDKNWSKTMEMYQEQQRLASLKDHNHHHQHSRATIWDAWMLTAVLKCANDTLHFQEGLQILEEMPWIQIVRDSTARDPKSSLQVANQAIKIYSGLLARSAQSEGGAKEKLRLQGKLEEARNVRGLQEMALEKRKANKKRISGSKAEEGGDRVEEGGWKQDQHQGSYDRQVTSPSKSMTDRQERFSGPRKNTFESNNSSRNAFGRQDQSSQPRKTFDRWGSTFS